MEPNIKKKKAFTLKTCAQCGQSFGPENYCRTKSIFYPKGYIPICNDCLEAKLRSQDFSWQAIDKFCQYMDIPFNPEQYEKLREINGERAFIIYTELFYEGKYANLNWKTYNDIFIDLEKNGFINQELPLIKEERRLELVEKWGGSYSDEGLNYLENLYNGILRTQRISGALNVDQALKICKISYTIDLRIESGEEFDKLLSSYDKLVKEAGFTPRNAKNASDFDSVGELCLWLEKRGFKNPFYNEVTKDIVDETIKNIQSWNRKLYTNESGIGEEITKRVDALESASKLENYYEVGTNTETELDDYDKQGYDDLMNEDFKIDLEEEGDEKL